MPRPQNALPIWIASGLVALVAVGGCSTRTSSIHGTVTYEGQPIQQGEITFTPADGVGPITGSAITGGKFAVSDIKSGKKIVQISDLPTLEFPKSTEELAKAAQQGARPSTPPPALVPANADGNGATVEIRPGKQTHDFHLKKPASR